MPKTLNILFLASEADPFVKVGGLGDVAGSLPLALRALLDVPLDVRLVIPFHSAIQIDGFVIKRELEFTIPRLGVDMPVEIFSTELKGMPVYMVSGEPIRRFEKVYDPTPNADSEKYIFFSLAALELVRRLGWHPDIIHANDWHTAASIYAVKRPGADRFWQHTRTVLSIHNLCFMGGDSEAVMTAYGLPPVDAPELPAWARQVPLALGMWAADKIVAVSPTYAEEIQTPEYGCGLEAFLLAHRKHVTGIINGIDTSIWDPSSDPFLSANFTEETLPARSIIKAKLQGRLGLELDTKIPLLGMVTRMDQQKGVDIVLGALRLLADEPWQAILLGTGNAELEIAARQMETDFPDRVVSVLRYDSKLAHRIYGGSDILLMPSRYEPCGLAQMIAMRYGCIPVVRETGGLRDTVAEGRTGFLFSDATSPALAAALRRALATYSDPESWQDMQRTGMAKNFSWEVSALKYVTLYRSLIHEAL